MKAADEEFDIITYLCARLNFDFTNKVEKLEDFTMVTPTSEVIMLKSSIYKVIKHVNNPFYKNLYPKHVIKQAMEDKTPPRCIFLPDNALIRSLLNAMIQKDPAETNETFLLKLGLLENPNLYLNYMPSKIQVQEKEDDQKDIEEEKE